MSTSIDDIAETSSSVSIVKDLHGTVRAFSGVAQKRYITWEVFAAIIKHKYLLGTVLNRDPGESASMLDFADHPELAFQFRNDYSNGSYNEIKALCDSYCGQRCFGPRKDAEGEYLCPITPEERVELLPRWFDSPTD